MLRSDPVGKTFSQLLADASELAGLEQPTARVVPLDVATQQLIAGALRARFGGDEAAKPSVAVDLENAPSDVARAVVDHHGASVTRSDAQRQDVHRRVVDASEKLNSTSLESLVGVTKPQPKSLKLLIDEADALVADERNPAHFGASHHRNGCEAAVELAIEQTNQRLLFGVDLGRIPEYELFDGWNSQADAQGASSQISVRDKKHALSSAPPYLYYTIIIAPLQLLPK